MHDWMQQICVSKELSTKRGKNVITVFPVLEEQTPRDIKGIQPSGERKWLESME